MPFTMRDDPERYRLDDTPALLQAPRDLSAALPMSAPGSQARDLIGQHLAMVITELGKREVS